MAFMNVLEINGETLPFPTSYDVDLTDVEADSSGETEAGTTQRDLVRQDVATITVSFSVSKRWLEKLSGFRNQARLNVRYFSPDALQYKSAQMYIDGYKAKLEHDTSYKGLWTVSFTLHEF
ncbi:MAG: hypothetical protein IJJ64_04735 [Butyrivibrio sp.]|nr:hypothetical protein [Butyrivibrio sp.]